MACLTDWNLRENKLPETLADTLRLMYQKRWNSKNIRIRNVIDFLNDTCTRVQAVPPEMSTAQRQALTTVPHHIAKQTRARASNTY